MTVLRMPTNTPESSSAVIDSAPRRLFDILGTDDDPSLRVVNVGVRDNVVRIKFLDADGAHAKHYFGEEALRVVTELISWSNSQMDSIE